IRHWITSFPLLKTFPAIWHLRPRRTRTWTQRFARRSQRSGQRSRSPDPDLGVPRGLVADLFGDKVQEAADHGIGVFALEVHGIERVRDRRAILRKDERDLSLDD